jgi:hypothetical protein
MTLLQEILDAAVRSDVPLTDLLRRCKVLSSRLRHAELGTWADQELNGYRGDQPLPEYRILKVVPSKGHFSGPLGSEIKNAPLPLSDIPKEARHIVEGAELREPIGAYMELVVNSDSGRFQIPWPADFVRYVATNFFESHALMAAWREISRGSIVALLDTVRNRILSFALAIQEEYPEAGEGPGGATTPDKERVAHVFHTHITGTVGNLALGNRDVTQEYTCSVAQGDMKSLREYIADLGVAAGDAAELETALKDDAKSKTTGIGKKVGTWLGHMTTKAYSGALKVGGAVAVKLLEKGIERYLGLPG